MRRRCEPFQLIGRRLVADAGLTLCKAAESMSTTHQRVHEAVRGSLPGRCTRPLCPSLCHLAGKDPLARNVRWVECARGMVYDPPRTRLILPAVSRCLRGLSV